VKSRIVLAALILAACSSASPAPKDFQPVAGAANAWSRGSGAAREEYSYTRKRFPGVLQDLASQVTIDVLLQNPGAKFRSSNPLPPCPAAAAIATFELRGGGTLQEGFAVHDGRALRALYVRPAGAPADAGVTDAMQKLLC
jgi:hypothetical protein